MPQQLSGLQTKGKVECPDCPSTDPATVVFSETMGFVWLTLIISSIGIVCFPNMNELLFCYKFEPVLMNFVKSGLGWC